MHVCLYSTCIPGTHGGEKRDVDALELELQMATSIRVMLGIEPGLEEQSGLLATAPSLQPPCFFLKCPQ